MELGKGRYATVWLGRFQEKPCVVKEPRTDVVKQFDNRLEIFSLDGLSHPNLVSVMGIWEDPSKPGAPPCVVMERCEMPLPEYLRANKNGALKRSHGSISATQIKLQILLDVVRGLIYLHQNDVLHGDLRSSNVLIQYESKESDIPLVKISDYGFSQHVDPCTKVRRAEILCEVAFLPPEMCDSSSVLKNATLTPQVDVFMFGDVALETATVHPVSRAEKVTDSNNGKAAILTEVERRTESFRKIVQLGDKDAFIRLISLCLAEKPEQRLSTTDIEDKLQSHISYYQKNPNAGERQDKAVSAGLDLCIYHA